MNVPTCLWCVSLGIGSLVVSYYDALGLEPWNMFERRRARESSRQTGRTTHGLLEAVALCVRHGAKTLLVDAPMSSQRGRYMINHAIKIVNHLSIPMSEVGPFRRGYWQPHVKYVDHETPTCHP